MKIKGIVLILIVAMLLVCFAGCGKDAVSETVSSAQSAAVNEEDGQNPVMNIIGSYMDRGSQRATMDILCEGNDGGRVTISWAGSAFEQAVWEFSGKWDEETHAIHYSNCRKAIRTYDESGNMTEKVDEMVQISGVVLDGDHLLFDENLGGVFKNGNALFTRREVESKIHDAESDHQTDLSEEQSLVFEACFG